MKCDLGWYANILLFYKLIVCVQVNNERIKIKLCNKMNETAVSRLIHFVGLFYTWDKRTFIIRFIFLAVHVSVCDGSFSSFDTLIKLWSIFFTIQMNFSNETKTKIYLLPCTMYV